MRKRVESTLESNPAAFSDYANTAELDLPAFQRLIEIIVPSMGKHESKTLFTSMDISNDGNIQASEIYCDMTMAILANRMKQTAVHPLEGSYFCLPSPPFVPDPKQIWAIEKLKVVFDEVVAKHSQPPPEPQTKPLPRATAPRQQKSAGLFASMFSGGNRDRAKAPPKTKPMTKVVALPMPNAPKGVYLYGGCGCGKTVLLDLFYRSLPEDFTARRLHYHEFIRDALRVMHSQPKGSDIFEAMADALSKQFRVLLLDELLITHISEAILVKNLFRHMWARGMTIITTSNYRPDELYAKGFNRDQFVDFIPDLQAQCPVLDIAGEVDYRQVDAGETSETFVHPITADTTTSMNNVFEALVCSSVDLNVALPIPQEKRHITIPAQGTDSRGASVARFSFDDLCSQNMGRADYSTIAEKYNTIFIYRVPKFEPDLGAEFRRFVSLTDILYGKKVAFICNRRCTQASSLSTACRVPTSTWMSCGRSGDALPCCLRCRTVSTSLWCGSCATTCYRSRRFAYRLFPLYKTSSKLRRCSFFFPVVFIFLVLYYSQYQGRRDARLMKASLDSESNFHSASMVV